MESVPHTPALDGASLDGAEDEIFDGEPDQDHRKQAGEHVRDLELVLVLLDEPAEPTGAGRYAEHELRGKEGAPGESPADLESGEDAGEGGRNQDASYVAQPPQAVVAPDHAQRIRHRQEAGVRIERDR